MTRQRSSDLDGPDRSPLSPVDLLPTVPPVSGFDRRRQATRAKLIQAAHEVMAQKGVETTTIAEITAAANVGFGSFYNHFSTKEDIARAVFAERTERLGRMADMAVQLYPDYARSVGTIGLTFIEMARADPLWGWFVIHADNAFGLMDEVLGERARRHVREGAATGIINVADPDIVAMLTLTSFLTLMRAMLESRATRPEAIRGIALVLRLYGVSDSEFAQIETLKLPAAIKRMLSQAG